MGRGRTCLAVVAYLLPSGKKSLRRRQSLRVGGRTLTMKTVEAWLWSFRACMARELHIELQPEGGWQALTTVQ
jgi:hypothetical protein